MENTERNELNDLADRSTPSNLSLSSPEELNQVCVLLREDRARISQVTQVSHDRQVYIIRITTGEEGHIIHYTYYVNEYWRNQIVSANITGETSEAQLSPEEETLLEQVLESEHQEIPVNSPTITIDETTSRFSGAIWYNEIQKQCVTLAGIGGIGSFVAFLLGRLKPERIILYDPDKVEAVNMSGQLYSMSDIGKYKASTLAAMISNYANYRNTVTSNDYYDKTSATTDIMICGFDNMNARKIFYEKWKRRVFSYDDNMNRKRCLFIDGRLAAEEFQVLSIQGNDERAMKEYESKWLFSDAEAEETVCSYKQTTFMANMIASVMVNVFVNFTANLCDPIIDRDVPFFISYDASTMFTKIEM